MRANHRLASLAALCLLGGLGAASSGAGPALADPACVSGCTVTIVPGPESTFTIPATATSVLVTVAGGSGGTYNPRASSASAPGGTVVVQLGTAYDGQTLHLIAGRAGFDSDGVPLTDVGSGGGGGSYVATESGFLIVAGGGGGANANGDGGAGGYATASADGQDAYPLTAVAGTGAVGATPGGSGARSGTVATVAPDGTIDPDDEDIGIAWDPDDPSTEAILGAYGGGGLAGGGMGSGYITVVDELNLDDPTAPIPPGTNVFYGAGGGSGFLAQGLAPVSTGPNIGDGFITIAWIEAVATSGELAATGIGGARGGLGVLLLGAGVILVVSARVIAKRRRMAG
jgi:hypothetical protein